MSKRLDYLLLDSLHLVQLMYSIPCFVQEAAKPPPVYMLEMRASGRDRVQDYADKFGAEFYAGEKPWGVKVDIAMPCATQNEIGMKEAQQLIANKVPYYIEVANMPTTNDALALLMSSCKAVGPAKAVNAGGVAVSALEMGQNSMRYNWTAEEVDAKLRQIMIDIHNI